MTTHLRRRVEVLPSPDSVGGMSDAELLELANHAPAEPWKQTSLERAAWREIATRQELGRVTSHRLLR